MVNQTKNQINALTQGFAGHILIGASTIPSDYILPPKELNSFPLGEDEMVLAAHPRLAAKFEYNNDNQWLKSIPFILRRESSGSRNAVISALERQNITLKQLNIVLEVDSNQALKSAVLHETGIGFMSRWAVQKELLNSELTVLPFSDNSNDDKLSCSTIFPNIKRNFYALVTNLPQPACVKSFFELL